LHVHRTLLCHLAFACNLSQGEGAGQTCGGKETIGVSGVHQQHHHPAYRADIDGLRAIAVASVVIYHAFPALFPAGFIGVDIFFVISGYLITQIILRDQSEGGFSFFSFYARRIRRILPALVLVLGASYAAGWFTQFSQDFKALGLHIAAAAGFISNLVLWREAGYFDTASELKPLLHLWSLAIEEQFYVLWPAALVLARHLRLGAVPLAAVLGLASLAACLVLSAQDATSAFFLSPLRFWEILAGAFVAARDHHARPLPFGARLSWPGAALLLVGFMTIGAARAFPGFWALLPVLGTACLIVAGPAGGANQLLATRPLVALGLVSYPLYLWHWPLLVFLRQWGGSSVPIWMVLLTLTLALGLAVLTYRLVELPIRFGRWRRPAPLVLLALLIGLGILGFNAYQREGLRFRPANKGNPVEFDWREAYRHKRCFLEARDAASNRYDPICAGRESAADPRPLVTLWGDSHAAALYPGFAQQAAARGFALAQFNASACPPVFDVAGDDRPECPRLNAFVRAHLAANPPHTLVMAGFWTLYLGPDKRGSGLTEAKIQATVEALRALGVRRIVLMGPLPAYRREVPKFGVSLFRPGEVTRTFEELDRAVFEVEARLQALAARMDVLFAAPLETLCTTQGCRISTSTERFEPVQWDGNHLTSAGAKVVLEGLLSRNPALLPGR
jgi:peptidoglycan/LPS O-acetylase OafA/YrhL